MRIPKSVLKCKNFFVDNRIFTFLLVGYVVALVVFFLKVIPITYENNWFYFFTYLFENRALPYIDYREGYPPLGFLVYIPIAYLADKNSTLFAYGMRMTNAAFLSLSLILIYSIVYRVRGKRYAILVSILFVALPSMTLSRLSNDVIALFFALLAIHFILSRKLNLTGLTIGSSFLVKGFPALLIIPAIRWFKGLRKIFVLLFSTIVAVYFLSLPFLIVDPFMYTSTFTHQGARGPWETIWALIDGWLSHGGFIHPDFDQFMYHYQLLKIYPFLPNDHAFYLWRYPLLPTFLLGCQIAMVVIAYLLMGKGVSERTILRGAGLAIIGYILFFQGYSPQFTVFALPIILISLEGFWVVCLSLVLEVATELQILAWNPAFGLTHDLHMPLLTSAILLRTTVFVATVILLSTRLYLDRKSEGS